MTFRIEPIGPERWQDFERLMGPHGAVSGCWCMWYRETSAEFNERSGDGNRLAMKDLVDGGSVTGLMAYDGDEPVGWISVAPRREYGRVERSRFFARVDDEQAWAVVCFWVPRRQRKRGLMLELLRGAIAYARDHGAHVLEGYPRDPAVSKVSADGAFVGLSPVFDAAGFVEVARRDEKRPIMRLTL